MDFDILESLETLEQAREVYGSKNQILVCIEELNELACVLAKFPRYEDEKEAIKELHDKVLDELSDVLIITDHVQAIFTLTDEEMCEHILKKISRLKRWLQKTPNMQQTMIDRELEDLSEVTCDTCIGDTGMCQTCMSTVAVEGVRPFYKKGR